MRGLRTDRTATVIITGISFVQNLRRGHYELGADLRGTFASLARSLN
jgi:IS6 family transposase